MFGEKSYSELSTEIKQGANTGEISEKSQDFLESKLQEFKNSDGLFEDYESKIMSQQLELHKDLQDVSEKYHEKKDKLTNKTITSLGTFINELSSSIISESEIIQIDGILDLKKYHQLKNNLDDSISLPGFIEYIQDSLKDNGGFDEFISSFTLFCMNNNVDLYFSEEILQLNKTDFRSLLTQYIYNHNSIDLPDQIHVNLDGGEVEFNITEIRDSIQDRISEESKKRRILDYFTDSINQKDFIYLQEDYGVRDYSIDSKVDLYLSLLNNGEVENNYIDTLYRNGDIDSSLHLAVLEKFPDFNLLEYYREYPLSQSIQDFVLDYSRNTLGLDNTEFTDSDILQNAHNFIITFLEIESTGRNVSNGTSSAEGYYQFLTLDGRYNSEGQRLNSSFQTALTRIKRLLPIDDFEERFGKQFGLHFRNQDPKQLNAENQTLLFLGHIIENGRDIGGKKADDFMELVLKEGNTWALKKIYYVLHHTAPDERTKKVFERVKNQNFYGNGEIIAKNHY